MQTYLKNIFQGFVLKLYVTKIIKLFDKDTFFEVLKEVDCKLKT